MLVVFFDVEATTPFAGEGTCSNVYPPTRSAAFTWLNINRELEYTEICEDKGDAIRRSKVLFQQILTIVSVQGESRSISFTSLNALSFVIVFKMYIYNKRNSS